MLKDKSIIYVMLLTGFGFVSFIPELMRVDSRIVTVPFRAINLFLIAYIYIKETRINHNLGWYLFFGFWTLYIIKAITAFIYEPNHLTYSPLEFFLFALGICFFPAYGFYLSIGSDEISRIKKVLYIFLSILSIISLVSSLGGFTAYKSFNYTDYRASGNSFFNPISLGHVSVSLCLLSYSFFIEEKGQRKRIIYITTFLIGLILLFLTGSRGPIVAIIISFFVYLLATMRRSSVLRNLFLIFTLLILIPSAIDYTTLLGSSLINRIDNLGNSHMMYYDVRATLFLKSIELFLAHPIWGISTLDIPGYGYPHNLFLEAFVIMGLSGGIIISLVLFYGIKKMIVLLRDNHPASWVGVLFLQYSIASFFSGNLYMSPEFWCLYMALIGIQNNILTRGEIGSTD